MFKRKVFGLFLLIFCVFFIAVVGCSSKEEPTSVSNAGDKTEVKVFKVVSFLPVDHTLTKDIVPMWMEKVEKETGGAIKIEWAGGPESIPSKDQFDAVRNGIADIGFNVSSYYGHLMPESLSMHLSPYTPAEERQNGYFDYLTKRFDHNDIVYLGRWLSPSPFHFWSNKEIKSLEDLKGAKFRSNPTYHDIMIELGITPIDINPTDVYTSLERGMVDGFGFPLLGPHENGWTEVTKYFIDAPFLNQNATILMNPEAFESLSSDHQQKLLELTAQFETEMIEYFNKLNEKERETIKNAGVQIISLNSEESKKFEGLVKKVKWESLQKSTPDQFDELKKLLYKE
jgi:TRAP-type C4-dicarboxylate transport system substrate-binding protein